MKHGLDPNDLHYAIFGGSLATSNNAAPFTNPYPQRGNDLDDCDSSGDEENNVTTMDTGPHSGDKRVAPSRGRKKKGKTKSDYEASMEALASALVTRFDKVDNTKQSR